jgi:transcriptional regulator with XRE-family HTH domain
MSLNDVATQSAISTATLSRIETGKQNIDVGLMIVIAGVLHLSPHDLLDSEGDGDANVADTVATLKPIDRARFWRDLTGSRKRIVANTKRVSDLSMEVEELLAQIDFLRGEVERIRLSLRSRRAPRRAAR